MNIGLAFWLIMLIWAIFGAAWHWPGPQAGAIAPYGPFGNWLLLFALFMLLGWASFGPPLRG